MAAGFSFGLANVTFQTMLRNPLASPDIIGISSGASAAAAVAIVSLGLGGMQVSVFAIVAALAVSLLMYALAFRDGVAGTRLILIGIGVAAILDSVTSYVLSRAAEWDLQEATRWLTGSLNGVTWTRVLQPSSRWPSSAPSCWRWRGTCRRCNSATTPPPRSVCASNAPVSP